MATLANRFGGGTRLVLELGRSRESGDADFLCAERCGIFTVVAAPERPVKCEIVPEARITLGAAEGLARAQQAN